MNNVMIAIIIIFLAIVVISASLANGQWEVAALFGGIAVLLLLMGAGERKDVRAWLNWRDYWYDGTPPGKRHSSRSVSATRVSNGEREEASLKREAYTARMKNCGHAQYQRRQTFVCHYCGRMVKATSDMVYTSEGPMRMYWCPECGRQNMTKI